MFVIAAILQLVCFVICGVGFVWLLIWCYFGVTICLCYLRCLGFVFLLVWLLGLLCLGVSLLVVICLWCSLLIYWLVVRWLAVCVDCCFVWVGVQFAGLWAYCFTDVLHSLLSLVCFDLVVGGYCGYV